MRSKEEIFEKHWQDYDKSGRESVYQAMEEYAKEKALELLSKVEQEMGIGRTLAINLIKQTFDL